MTGSAGRPSRLRRRARAWTRQGWARTRAALIPVLQASVAAGLAYAIARYVMGHEFPFFAPVAAWVSLGFSRTRQLRHVAELGIGVAVGVALGELVVSVIGSGPIQVGFVLALSALLARFIDRGPMLTTQAGAQAMVIMGLPLAGAAGAVGRWSDAAIGAVVALAIAVLSPVDPRRPPRAVARRALGELAEVLALLAGGLRDRDPHDVEEALVRGRGSESVLDEWRNAARSATELARVSPQHRRFRPELVALTQAALSTDRAMRNTRVLARRARGALPAGLDLTAVADALTDLSEAAWQLRIALSSGRDPAVAQAALREVAQRADPWTMAPDDWHAQSLVLLLRSLVVDMLEAAGLDEAQARADLPPI